MCKQTTGDDTCEVWEVCPLPKPLLKLEDLLSNMILCSLNKKQSQENLGQKRLSDNTKVEFGATKDHG